MPRPSGCRSDSTSTSPSRTSRPTSPKPREIGRRSCAVTPRNRLARWVYNPALARRIGACIADQVAEFASLYERPPSHFDGHHHVHTCPSVVFSGALPANASLRPTFSFLPGEKGTANRLIRSGWNRYLRSRFLTATHFCDVQAFGAGADPRNREIRTELAQRTSVEVMSHPRQPADSALLLSDSWAAFLETVRVGTYEDLRNSTTAATRTPG